jgi:glutathione S-transferase
MHPMIYPALATIAALMVYFGTLFNAGRARGKYGVKAPAVTGHEGFERAYRVQMNTLEQLALFLPGLWLCAVFANAAKIAAGLGAVWVVGRILYARAYRADPAKRGLGFALTIGPSILLILGALAGIALGAS